MSINSVGELVLAARNGRSQKDFAALLGVKQSSVSRYESGKASPPISVIEHCMRLVHTASSDESPRRLHAMGAAGYENEFKLTLHENRLEQPLARKKPTVYFVNSMSDLFHEEVTDKFLDDVFSVIEATPHHTYQILTKRAERLPEYFGKRACPQNVWLGVSVEDKKYGVPRIDHLRKVDAHIRFLSVEPLLEDLGRINLRDIHWVIVGGESGHKARPMREEYRLGGTRKARFFERLDVRHPVPNLARQLQEHRANSDGPPPLQGGFTNGPPGG